MKTKKKTKPVKRKKYYTYTLSVPGSVVEFYMKIAKMAGVTLNQAVMVMISAKTIGVAESEGFKSKTRRKGT